MKTQATAPSTVRVLNKIIIVVVVNTLDLLACPRLARRGQSQETVLGGGAGGRGALGGW